MIPQRRSTTATLLVGWTVAAVFILVGVSTAVVTSARFAADVVPIERPILPFVVAIVAAGALFLCLLQLIRWSRALRGRPLRHLVLAIFLVGMSARALLLLSQPILEVDFNRYLWDGAVTAQGLNPYAHAPRDVAALPYDDRHLELSKAAGPVFDGISYPELKTIYPPVAMVFFALAYKLSPFSLTAWRLVCLIAEVVTFGLLLLLLREAGRTPLAVVLYWWSPLVLKEVVNSAHVEAVLLPFVLGCAVCALRGRHLAATVLLTMAIGIKLWPLLLAPLVLRPLLGEPQRLLRAIGVLSTGLLAYAFAYWQGGLGEASGLLAFARHWHTGSALLPVLERGVTALLAPVPSLGPYAGLIVRLSCTAIVLAVAMRLARPPIAGARDLLQRIWLTVTVLLLLSPAQFPWYLLWVLPFAVVHSGIGWHVATASMPLYYAAFHFRVRGDLVTFESMVVWLIWLPAWLALAYDLCRCRQQQERLASSPLARARP